MTEISVFSRVVPFRQLTKEELLVYNTSCKGVFLVNRNEIQAAYSVQSMTEAFFKRKEGFDVY